MAPKRYEIIDEQWERIKDMLTRAKTGRPPKIIDRCSMHNIAERKQSQSMAL